MNSVTREKERVERTGVLFPDVGRFPLFCANCRHTGESLRDSLVAIFRVFRKKVSEKIKEVGDGKKVGTEKRGKIRDSSGVSTKIENPE